MLYLLHGLSDDDTTWVRRTSIERYVAPLGLAVVMPAGHRSFYADEALGGAYWTFLTEELPALVQPLLPGVGADRPTRSSPDCRWAATARGSGRCGIPDRIAAAASLSGAVDLAAHRGRLRLARGPAHVPPAVPGRQVPAG